MLTLNQGKRLLLELVDFQPMPLTKIHGNIAAPNDCLLLPALYIKGC